MSSSQFFEIRINSVSPNSVLTFDIYLMVNSKSILFRKKGELLTPDRLKTLAKHGGEKFLVPEEQRVDYLASIQNVIKNPSSSTEEKAKFIKESAFLHLHELFTKQDISQVLNDATNLVVEMVNFVSTDVAAAASLMRLSIHDYYTYNHCVDVGVYSIVLAKKLFGGDKDILIKAGLGGLLHDIGKRNIDFNIINKKAALTPEEWEEVKKHPEYGIEFIKDIPSIPEDAKSVVLEHHENFDGTGYPKGLQGDEISKLARLVSIADVFDALTTNRSYHKAVGPDEALNIMYGMQPGKFDPNIFKSFDKNFSTKSNLSLPEGFDPCAPQKFPIKKAA